MTESVVWVGVTMSAVTGCVTVHGEAEAPPSAAAVGRSHDRGPAGAEEAAGGASPPGRPPPREVPSRPEPSGQASPPIARQGPAGTATDPRHAPADQDPGSGVSGAVRDAAPGPRSAIPRVQDRADVCALVQHYGRWPEGSVPAQACAGSWSG
ncbi:hypothetical protein [Streptomyces sp. TR06-5]|uniref:hypothetical protein n=1 Tax=Streptomyces sp. TR06-5 TaxID=3385976 RepID=UPI0039A26DE7